MEDLIKSIAWTHTPSIFDLVEKEEVTDDQPAFNQLHLQTLTRGLNETKIASRWKTFLEKIKGYKEKEIIVDKHPVWIPLIELHTPMTGKAVLSYKQTNSTESVSTLKVLGTGFGETLTTSFKNSIRFSSENSSKSFEMQIIATVIRFTGKNNIDLLQLNPQIPPDGPAYRIVDLEPIPTPKNLDPARWTILQRIDLRNAGQNGEYIWEREKISDANWKINLGFAMPVLTGVDIGWNMQLTESEAFAVEYTMPYGKEYTFFQPAGESRLTPFCSERD
jgi:hypothetical protein